MKNNWNKLPTQERTNMVAAIQRGDLNSFYNTNLAVQKAAITTAANNYTGAAKSLKNFMGPVIKGELKASMDSYI